MSLTVTILVCLAGGAGAVARLLLDGAVSARSALAFPTGTLLVNVLGAFALGVLFGAAVGTSAADVVGTGLIGSFTTFSTWMLESHRLGEDGEVGLGVANLAVSLVLGVLAAWAGQHIGGLV